MNASQLSLSVSGEKRAAWTAAAAVAGLGCFVALLVALHLLRPDHDPIRQTTSQYVIGAYGQLMTLAFLSLSAASLAVADGLRRSLAPSARSRPGIALLAAWGIGLLIAMLFPINLDGTPLTTAARIHRINGPLTFLSFVVGSILISRRLDHDPAWRPVQRSARALSLLILFAFLAMLLNIAGGLGYAGLAQRVALALIVAWLLEVAVRLRATSDDGSAEA